MSEDLKPHRYEPIALSSESTVVAEFVPKPGVHEPSYQSEAALERDLIAQLQKQAYDYLPITSEAALIANLRAQLEALNKIAFSDAEWQRFFSACIAGANDGLVEKTARIQEDHVQLLKRDDGSTKNIYLIDKQNIHNNVNGNWLAFCSARGRCGQWSLFLITTGDHDGHDEHGGAAQPRGMAGPS